MNWIVVRGAGDLATGVIQKLHRSGMPVLVLETEKPTAIRRYVCLSECVYDGSIQVEDMTAYKVGSVSEAEAVWKEGMIPVLIDSMAEVVKIVRPWAVVDAIIAKKNMGTNKAMAPVTIGLGPGFTAPCDVDVVIETMRGHNLGRMILDGAAVENTGAPGNIAGYTKERVIYAPKAGTIRGVHQIADIVAKGQVIGYVGQEPVYATISGVIRGFIRDGFEVFEKMKIGDIDPRAKEVENCRTISDKARCLGGAVLEALLYQANQKGVVPFEIEKQEAAAWGERCWKP